MTTDSSSRVAVIGAGMAGLTCARDLADAGMHVTVFDKARGPSGRLSTRRRDGGQWDHGAPYFEAREAAFVQQCRLWEAQGVLAPFGPDGAYTGVPRMSALGRLLARDFTLVTGCRVASVVHSGARWLLTDTEGTDRGAYDQVVVAVPAPQAVPLLAAAPSWQRAAERTEMLPVHALLLCLGRSLDDVPVILRPETGPLALLVRNSQKPGRPGGDCWVAHTRVAWTREVLEDDPGSLAPQLVAAFSEAVGQAVDPVSVQVHRWRYAHATKPGAFDPGFAWNAVWGLGVCGDWCAGGGVEAAWTSGKSLARAMLAADGPS